MLPTRISGWGVLVLLPATFGTGEEDVLHGVMAELMALMWECAFHFTSLPYPIASSSHHRHLPRAVRP